MSEKINANPITESVELLPIMVCYIIIGFDIILNITEVFLMFMEERHQEISEIIKINGKITIAEITSKYGISDESARRV